MPATALQPARFRAGGLARTTQTRGARSSAPLRGIPEELCTTCLRSGRSQTNRCATFVLAEVPIAAVKTHLQQRKAPPPLVDELITKTYHAIVDCGDLGRSNLVTRGRDLTGGEGPV